MTTYRSFDRACFIGMARAYRAAVEAAKKLNCKFKLEVARQGTVQGYVVRLVSPAGAFLGYLAE